MKPNIKYVEDFYSKILDNTRNIAIYLPPSYEKDKNKHYPVLYMHDGQNLFSEIKVGSKYKWKAGEIAESLINQNKIEEIIIVGIYNTSDRISEYTPTYDSEKNMGGKGKEYAKFIVEELKPYIDQNFRTLPNGKNTTIAGSSLGGLISFYIAWNYPSVFNNVAAISPSFWWDSNYMESEVKKYTGERKKLKIWIDAGTAEERNDRDNDGIIDMVDDARDMIYALMNKGYKLGKDIRYYEVMSGVHNEMDWSKRFNVVLLNFFGKDKSPKPVEISVRGWDEVSLSYKKPFYIIPVITYTNGLKETPLLAEYRSSNENVIKVKDQGWIQLVNKGTADIVIKTDKITGIKRITVIK